MKNELLNGMYVRCPFDAESEDYPRTFIMGKIVKIDKTFNEVKVEFFDLKGLKDFLLNFPKIKEFHIDDVVRCTILKSETILYTNKKKEIKGKVIKAFKKKGLPYTYYYVSNEHQIEEVCEVDIKASFNAAKVNPFKQLLNYEFQNPRWYLSRNIVSSFVNILENAPVGFETLVGARAYLYPHQIDTIMRASKQMPCRLMLADEVGLGKTIEALIIANTLSRTKENFRTLIIVPVALMNQWKNEFDIKLWLNAEIYRGIEINDCNNIIIPLEEINDLKYFTLLKQQWDLVIIDEVHKIIKNQVVYNRIFELSKRVENILILTATPISERRTEYLNLLKLLKPSIYEEMTPRNFDLLVDKNNKIKQHVCEIRDLLEEYFDAEEPEILEDVLSELEEINDYLEDDYINKLLSSIDLENEEEETIESINSLLSYIAEYYQIDRDILRHRRMELKTKFANRTLTKVSYRMQDADQSFYEYETYQSVLEYINSLKEKKLLTPSIYKELLNRMFSSPFTLKKYLLINTTLPHDEYYNSLMKQVDLFINGLNQEINNPGEYLERPELLNSRFTKLLDYLDQEAYDQKVVIFTSYPETAIKIDEMLSNYFDKSIYRRFFNGLSEKELNSAINDFQIDSNVLILLCDYTAGEGRNLQMADQILHFDLPISPSTIEQRIGRLDRIGRDVKNDVLSVVLYTQDSIEESLLRLWDEAFNLFGESLSGLEIALEDFELILNDYLLFYKERMFEEVLENFKKNMKKLNKILREERLFDANRQLSKRTQLLIENLIEKIDANQGENLSKSMKSWGTMVGFRSEKNYTNANELARFTPQNYSIGSFNKAWYIPLKTTEILKRSKLPNEIIGTYNRKLAIEDESLAFFAPGEPIFDSLLYHAMTFYKGTCMAIEISSDFEFSGFMFKWKTKFRDNYLLANQLSLENINDVKGLNIVQTELDLVRRSGDESITAEQIEQLVQKTNWKDITHLGERKGVNSQVKLFMEENPLKVWNEIVVESRAKSLQQVKERSQKRLNVIKKQFSKNYRLENIAHKNAREFYGNSEGTVGKGNLIYKALIKGIENCEYELDSVYYIRVKKNG